MLYSLFYFTFGFLAFFIFSKIIPYHSNIMKFYFLTGVLMNQELKDEMNYEIQLLIKSGFYSDDDILEIIGDEFIEENLSDDEISKLFLENRESLVETNEDSEDFINLRNAFLDLTKENIISIHNAGYDIEEGIQDSFELFTHLRNNKYSPIGFCFYTFEDIENVIEDNTLSIAFGDFEYDEEKGLEIAQKVAETLKSNGFDINWNDSIDELIEIQNFNWIKHFDNKEYSMDGALEDFLRLHSEENE